MERILNALNEAGAFEAFIVGGSPERFGAYGVRVVQDDPPGFGVVGGIAAGLSAMRGDAALTVGCDMPFLTGELLKRIASRLGNADAAAAETEPRNRAALRRVSKVGGACVPRDDAGGRPRRPQRRPPPPPQPRPLKRRRRAPPLQHERPRRPLPRPAPRRRDGRRIPLTSCVKLGRGHERTALNSGKADARRPSFPRKRESRGAADAGRIRQSECTN